MNRLFSFLVLFVSTHYCFSQYQEVRITYQVDYLPDSLDPDYRKTENMFLFVDGTFSKFLSENRHYNMDTLSKKLSEQIELTGAISLVGNRPRPTHFHFMVYKEAQKISVFHFLPDLITYSEKWMTGWQLSKESSQIAGYTCYKATIKYGGRNFIAWYTPEIPIYDGPYTFCGLPGLILKVFDDRKHFVFELIDFESTQNSNVRNLPDYDILSTKKEVFMLLQNKIKDPISFTRSMMSITLTPEEEMDRIERSKRNSNLIEIKY